MTRICVVEREKCVGGKTCPYLCMKVCPINRTGDSCIVIAGDKKVNIDEKLCVGCGICPKRCPSECLHIINLPEELKAEPVHRYGQNGFALYSLPIPMFGKVVGIMGKNGIGKSTALNILAGVIKPNFGKVDEKQEGQSYKFLIDQFKGTEAQLFFEKIRDKKIKISYKPQQVSFIPKQFSGKVKDLLKKVDEKGEFEKIVDTLEIRQILENDIKDISGGELQRVAVAATVLKKANFYVFDEPSSYLDIKQRINVSRFIRSLANEDTAVLVVEHDLIILDYMTDLVHLMYGNEGVYGVVSMPKTTRVGINVYLSGYLKEENVRFREKEIKFDVRPPQALERKQSLCSWGELKKLLGRFDLSAEEGNIPRHQVVGVLGENGIGKTSFVKMLAGVIKTDSGEIEESIKVSYKPQYIEPDDTLVMVALQDAVHKHDVSLIRPLNIKPLLAKKLNELSGGELQRVAIASALSKEADLFLLDEPSAYLDVEQRLLISKIIRGFMEEKGTSALVVDHDLLFLDYVSGELMVFEGISGVKGRATGPYPMREGMSKFLKSVDITLRRDKESHRPRINSEGSVKDREQKSSGNYYYEG